MTERTGSEGKVDGGSSRIEAKLETIIRLIAMTVAPSDLSLKDRALRLQRAGMTPKEIAALCDTTPNTVSVIFSAAKRESKSKSKSKNKNKNKKNAN